MPARGMIPIFAQAIIYAMALFGTAPL